MNQKEQKNASEKTVAAEASAKAQPAKREQSRGDEIDLLELGRMLLSKWYYIVVFGLIGAIALGAYSYFCIAPTYQSTAKMYIASASDDSVVNLSDLNIGTSLTADYENLMTSYPILEEVISELGLDMTYTQLAGMIEITNPTDTRILQITATSTDANLSKDIANTMMKVAIDYLPKTMSTEEPNIAQEARAASFRSAPSYQKYTVMGALLGIILYCAYAIFRYLMDDTIHTAEDMEKYFGITPLTVIPDIAVVEDMESKKKKRK